MTLNERLEFIELKVQVHLLMRVMMSDKGRLMADRNIINCFGEKWPRAMNAWYEESVLSSIDSADISETEKQELKNIYKEKP